MKQKIWQVLFILFWAVFLLSACAEQKVEPSPISAETLAPSNTLQPTKTIPLSTRTPKPTKTLYPTWTPIATATAAPNLCVKNPVPSEFFISQPTIENDKLIAFSSIFRTVKNWRHSDIYTIAFDGSNLKRLTYYSGDDDMYRWTPDGKQILFGSDRSHQAYVEGEPGYSMEPFKKELFIMNVDGSGSRKVTADLPYYSGRSPDGKFIAYEKDYYNEARLENWLSDYLTDMLVANIDGSYQRNITKAMQPGSFFYAEWSPDSKYFAFLGGTEPYVESSGGYWREYIYLVNADGTNLRKLEGGPLRSDGYREKTWSSDGKHLAFLTAKGIAIVNADGSRFSEYPVKYNDGPRDIFWSDDNQQLIFTDGNDTFYQINTDFTHLEKLPLVTKLQKLLYRMQLLKTRGLREQWDPKQNHSSYYYELSPDGKWLAYLESGTYPNNPCRQIRIRNTETGENYFILDREGLVPYLLNNSPNDELKIISADSVLNSSQFGNLIWSPDSKQLLFTNSYDGLNAFQHQDFFAINLDGTGLRLIMDDVWYPAIQP
jgi:Tol biopolymer transport system component